MSADPAGGMIVVFLVFVAIGCVVGQGRRGVASTRQPARDPHRRPFTASDAEMFFPWQQRERSLGAFWSREVRLSTKNTSF